MSDDFAVASQQAILRPQGDRWTVRVERPGTPRCPDRRAAVPFYLLALFLHAPLSRLRPSGRRAYDVLVVDTDWTDNDVAVDLGVWSRGLLQPSVGAAIWRRRLPSQAGALQLATQVRDALQRDGRPPT